MTHNKNIIFKYLVATLSGLTMIATGFVNSATAQTIPTIVSLPAAPTRLQIQGLAVKALLSAAQAQSGGTLVQMQNAAAQTLLSELNAPNALNPNGGTVTLVQALTLVTSDPAAAQAAAVQGLPVVQTLPPQAGVPGITTVTTIQPFSPQVQILLAQNAVAALQQALALQLASQAASAAQQPLPPASAPVPVATQPAIPTNLPTIVSLPAAPTRAEIQTLAVNAVMNAIQSGGVLTQVQNVAAQTLLSQLNAPNALNPNGGTVTLVQALAVVNAAAAQVAATGGVTVFQALPPQAGVPTLNAPGSVLNTVPVFTAFTPQQNAILAQMTAASALTSAVQPPVAPVTSPVVQPVTQPIVTPTPVQTPATQPVLQTPAVQPAIPTVASLPAALTSTQVQNLAVNALVAAAQAGGTLAQVQSAAAQTLVSQLNAPNAVNPNGGTVTLVQALTVVTSDPVAGQAVLAAPGSRKATLLLAQNAVATLQQTLALQQAAANAVPAPTAQPAVVTPPAVQTPPVAAPAQNNGGGGQNNGQGGGNNSGQMNGNVQPPMASPVVTPPIVTPPVVTPPAQNNGGGGGGSGQSNGGSGAGGGQSQSSGGGGSGSGGGNGVGY
jgi:hypothetical protein